MDERLARFVRERVRRAGRQYERARRAYAAGKGSEATPSAASDLPTDEAGRCRLVCRRYAEKRAVDVDAAGRPACFEADHPDCVGCVEDVREGRIETW